MRGLKLLRHDQIRTVLLSHLTRGAWIEISDIAKFEKNKQCRTSHEVRGLKCCCADAVAYADGSHLTRGAWIEILYNVYR